MAFFESTIWEVLPGRRQEALAHVLESRRIHGHHGKRVLLHQVHIGGSASDRVAHVVEHESLAAFGELTAVLSEDEEWVQHQQAMLDSASPAVRLSSHQLTREIPGLEAPLTITGCSVRALTRIRPNQGGLEHLVKLLSTLKAVVEANGATVSAQVLHTGGDNTGVIALIFTYPDIRTFGTGADRLEADPAYLRFIEELQARDAPGAIVSRSMSIETPR